MHQLSVKLLSDWQSHFGLQNCRYMAYCSKMRQAAKLHKVPNTDVNFIWRQKMSEQNKWGGGRWWVAFCWELDAILQLLVQWHTYCKYTNNVPIVTPHVSFICWEEAGNFTKADTKYVTAVIWRNFYLKKEIERSSSHIPCITAVKLTLQTLCRHLIHSILTLQSQLDVHGSAHRDTITKLTSKIHYID